MRTAAFILALLLLISLTGCAKAHLETANPPAEPTAAQQQQTPTAPATPQQPAANTSSPQASKQLEVTGTDVKPEKPSILSDVVCRFNKTDPVDFSFRITNTENKQWYFKYIPTGERQDQDNPLVVLNARQLNDGTMITACGKRSIAPNESVLCSFDIPNTPIVSTQLFGGETGWGNLKNNTLNLKTVDHSAQLWFVCEE